MKILTCHVTEISPALRGASSLTTKPDTALAACSIASWKRMKNSRNVAHKDSLHHCKDKFCWCHLCHVTSLRHVCAYQVCACGMHITHVCELRVCGQVCVHHVYVCELHLIRMWHVCHECMLHMFCMETICRDYVHTGRFDTLSSLCSVSWWCIACLRSTVTDMSGPMWCKMM